MKPTTLILPVLAIILGLVSPSGAQTAPKPASVETVTVTGIRDLPAKTVETFVKTYAAPTPFLGKLARWADGICPKVTGLKPEAISFIEKRIKEVAAMVGAKVDPKTPCRANVEIVFTPTPQAFMDDIRKNNPRLLGFFNNSSSQADRLAVVKHPVQAWYDTQTVDYLGNKFLEENLKDCRMRYPFDWIKFCAIGSPSMTFSDDGESSDFTNVLIVADTTKIGDITTSSLADYVAVLALSQTQLSDSCRNLPTIANLLLDGCEASLKAATLTDSDLAYLRGLYKMESGDRLTKQRDNISKEMEKSLQVAGKSP